jgi:tRNA dimethylallyltransferase
MREEIPIVVGGTSYWMQHLMFPDRLAGKQPETSPVLSESITGALASLPPHLLDLFNCLPQHPPDAAVDPDAATALHLLLHHLDPAVAARWHWRDTRKVLRSLRIVKDTGRRPSEIMSEQSEIILKPRCGNTICRFPLSSYFWSKISHSLLLAVRRADHTKPSVGQSCGRHDRGLRFPVNFPLYLTCC